MRLGTGLRLRLRRWSRILFRTLLQRGAKLSAWTLVAEVEVELVRSGYAARCSGAGCRQHSATPIVRYLDAHDRPLRQLVEVCDEHADLIKRKQWRSTVRDLRDSLWRNTSLLFRSSSSLGKRLPGHGPLNHRLVTSSSSRKKFSSEI